jgi:hypothetical protein
MVGFKIIGPQELCLVESIKGFAEWDWKGAVPRCRFLGPKRFPRINIRVGGAESAQHGNSIDLRVLIGRIEGDP